MREIDNNKQGFTIGEVLVVFGIVLMVVFLLQPFVRQTNEKADRVGCLNNLRELGRATNIYAREHYGKFPPTIKTLYEEEYLANIGALDCPSTKKIGTLNDPEYVYTPGLSVSDPSMMELLKDADGNHPGGYGVLTVNGTVVWKENTVD